MKSIKSIREARFIDEKAMESQGYRIYKGQSRQRVMPNLPHLIDKVQKHHTSILMGDFNAQIGKELRFKENIPPT